MLQDGSLSMQSTDGVWLRWWGRAQDFADRMMPAFDTPTGIPRGVIDLGTRVSTATPWAGGGNSAVLSELGSIQVCTRPHGPEFCSRPLLPTNSASSKMVFFPGSRITWSVVAQ